MPMHKVAHRPITACSYRLLSRRLLLPHNFGYRQDSLRASTDLAQLYEFVYRVPSIVILPEPVRLSYHLHCDIELFIVGRRLHPV